MSGGKLIALMGESGCGKSSVAAMLDWRDGIKSVQSYTDRPKRSPVEGGHIFVSAEEYDKIPNDRKVAETTFDGHRYCATADQVDECGVYVIDPDGYSELLKRYRGSKEVVPIYISTTNNVRYWRMRHRGDSDAAARERLHHDIDAFLYAPDIDGVHVVDGNGTIEDTVREIEEIADVWRW